ncbi:MAG: asparagine synthase (glutamine-hydrolyzing) [Rhodocyclaceae bacterium]
MCGIAGWIASSTARLDRATLAAMLRAIAHRGPDDEGMYDAPAGATGQRVFLGHRRLSIIDPDGARQPMCAAGLALVFNGEIYNFRELRDTLVQHGYSFSRDSDTEVLLRAYQHWGDDLLHRLRGSFAFAIWDEGRERLFMARDRFGEKPLYLYENGGSLYFASEVKALLCVPDCKARVDVTAVRDYLAYRYVPAPKTLFAGIRKLMPGTCAVWQGGQFSERRYWQAPDGQACVPQPAASDVVGDFLARLDGAVKLQMVSDVPFGAFLSGGLDSSMIVALMTRHCPLVNTFSVGFGEDRYSELAYAAQVARQFGTTHHELTVSSSDLVEQLPKLVAFRDAPVSEPSDIAIYLLACEAARSVKMVLTGEGSDEILGGYPKHVFERLAGGYQHLPRALRNGLIAPLVQALPYRFRRAKTAMANLNIEDWRERQVRWFGALSHRERDRLSVLRGSDMPPPGAPPFDADPGIGSLRRILYFDQTSWLPDNLLERGDRMSMAASIEARVPFLDHQLAEFVSTLPDDCRVRGTRTKWILREAGKQLLPPSILARPKVGFRVPVNEWMRGTMRDFLLDHLQGAQSLTRAYFEPAILDGLLADHLTGKQNHEKLLWSLLNLEVWHRQYAAN